MHKLTYGEKGVFGSSWQNIENRISMALVVPSKINRKGIVKTLNVFKDYSEALTIRNISRLQHVRLLLRLLRTPSVTLLCYFALSRGMLLAAYESEYSFEIHFLRKH